MTEELTETEKDTTFKIIMLANDESRVGGIFLMGLILFPINLYTLDILRGLFSEAAMASRWEHHLDMINTGINIFPWLHIFIFGLIAIKYTTYHQNRVSEIYSCSTQLRAALSDAKHPTFNPNTYLFTLWKLNFGVNRNTRDKLTGK